MTRGHLMSKYMGYIIKVRNIYDAHMGNNDMRYLKFIE